MPPRPEQPQQTAQGTVASEKPLTRNRFSATRGLYVLALLTGPIGVLCGWFAPYSPAGSLTFLFVVAALVGAVLMIRRSFRPGAERITLGRALIATGLVPTGVLPALYLLLFAYMLIPSRYLSDSDGNDGWWVLGILIYTVMAAPVIALLLGAGLTVRGFEKRKALAVQHSLATGVPVPETSGLVKLSFRALTGSSYLLALYCVLYGVDELVSGGSILWLVLYVVPPLFLPLVVIVILLGIIGLNLGMRKNYRNAESSR